MNARINALLAFIDAMKCMYVVCIIDNDSFAKHEIHVCKVHDALQRFMLIR